jgi:excisionase family DNA binding protein
MPDDYLDVALPTPEASPWLTVEEARREVKVGAKSIYRAIQRGDLRAARLGGRSGSIRIHRSWICDWLERSAQPIEIGHR